MKNQQHQQNHEKYANIRANYRRYDLSKRSITTEITETFEH